jgi:hypothetical protein
MSFEDDLDLVEVAIWLAVLGGIAYVVWKYLIPLFRSGTGAANALATAGSGVNTASNSLSSLTDYVKGELTKWGVTATPATTSQTGAAISCKMPCGGQTSVGDAPISAVGSPAGGGCASGNTGCCFGVHCCIGS